MENIFGEHATAETVALRTAITGAADLARHLLAEVQKKDPGLAAKILEVREVGEYFVVAIVFAPDGTKIELAVRTPQNDNRLIGTLNVEYQRLS